MSKSYAYYRLPYSNTYTKVMSESAPDIITDLKDIGNASGFVFVPFCTDEQHPAVLIKADQTETHDCVPCTIDDKASHKNEANTPSADYAENFHTCHSAIQSGQFSKIVLARSCSVPYDSETPELLFHKACSLYPRAMIMLVSTELTGTWLIATPEVLLENENDRFRTMALAGTMPYNEGLPVWSLKNQQEQHIVEEYIDKEISPFIADVIKDGPHTVRTANLVHLCTTFRFHLKQNCSIGDIIDSLHPTPAVCGLPKAEALQFIMEHEHCERSYYSGFAGPVCIDNATRIYVSLRCMQIHPTTCTLYAGGGIMPYSQLNDEWQETENKMSTMQTLLNS